MRVPLGLACAVVAGVAALVAVSPVAQGATPQAEAHNDRGKALYREHRFADAVNAFRAASALDPDPRYAWNRCVALEKLARWDEALAACDEVFVGGATDALKAKAGERSAALRRARAAAPAPAVPGAQPTSAPSSPYLAPGAAGVPAGPPPGSTPEVPSPANRDYRWALGVGLGSALRGTLGTNADDGTTPLERRGSSFELHLDAHVLPRWRVGVRALLMVQSFVAGGDAGARKLQISDLGGAAYVHVPLGPLVLTPLVGLQLGVQQPDSLGFTGEPFGVASLRVGATADLVRGHHVFSFGPVFTAYLPSSGSPEAAEQPETYGLDRGGVTVAFLLGYAYRFTTIGIPGLVSLE